MIALRTPMMLWVNGGQEQAALPAIGAASRAPCGPADQRHRRKSDASPRRANATGIPAIIPGRAPFRAPIGSITHSASHTRKATIAAPRSAPGGTADLAALHESAANFLDLVARSVSRTNLACHAARNSARESSRLWPSGLRFTARSAVFRNYARRAFHPCRPSYSPSAFPVEAASRISMVLPEGSLR